MVIKVDSVKSGMKNEFEIRINNELKYCAYSCGIKNINNLYMTNVDNDIILSSSNNNMLFSKNKFDIFNNEKQIISEYYFEAESEFIIKYNNKVLNGYYRNEKYNTCISFYKDDIQVAEVVKSKVTINGLDRYFIFLLDEYNYLDKILSFFVIYYDYCYYNNSSCGSNYYRSSISVELVNEDCIDSLKWVKENFNSAEYINIDKVARMQHQKASQEVNGTFGFLLLIAFFVFGTMLLVKMLSK